ncbi:MAG: YigZ family protein [Muribaculaceae bacterium]|nr:YigZ family protein [Muribaculaceae bacterium]
MEYLTLQSPAKAVVREKMSRFIAFAMPAADPDEARSLIADIANQYHDARHVCWAYRCGPDGSLWQVNDNGEPSGTAGRPILGQIRSAGITNVAIAVVRYFGGIKLGTSGLITAYSQAAQQAIEAGEIVTACVMQPITFTFPYLAMNSVQRLIKSWPTRITAQDFNNTCTITLEIRADRAEELKARLADIDGLSLNT